MTRKAKPDPAKDGSPPGVKRKGGDIRRAARKTGSAKNPNGAAAAKVPETGGRGGPDPTRYGDWEKDGRCVDF